MHQITLESLTRLGTIEWREVIQAKNKAAAARKAYSLIRSTGEAVRINKTINQFDANLETWRIE